MSTTIKMPTKRHAEEEAEVRASQIRPQLKRFRVCVDRQVKSSFDDAAEADKIAMAIKRGFPIVNVAVYDAENSITKDIELTA